MNVLNIMPAAATVRKTPATTSTMTAGRGPGGVPLMLRGSGTRPARLLHHVKRPALHPVVGAAEVFADHADADQLHTPEKHQQRDDGGEADLSDFDSEQPSDDEKQADGEADQSREHACIGDKSQRQVG